MMSDLATDAPTTANVADLFGDDSGSDSDEDAVNGEQIIPNVAEDAPIQGELNVIETPLLVEGASKLVYTRLPNVVGIQTNPYDERFYDAEEEQQLYAFTNSLIRWKYKVDEGTGELARDEDGKYIPESNSRITTWSNGSQTLTVGSEHFELVSNPASTNYLMITQQDNSQTVLQGVGKISAKLTPRPLSTNSSSHKALATRVRQKSIKRSRIIETITSKDPELEAQQKAKAKEDKVRGQKRKKATTGMSMDAGYLEQDDSGGGGGISLKELRRQAAEDDFGDDSDEEEMQEEDDWVERRQAGGGRRSARNAANDDSDDSDDDDDDDDAGGASSTANDKADAPPPPPSTSADNDDDDSDDDDDEDVVVTKKRKKTFIDDDEDE